MDDLEEARQRIGVIAGELEEIRTHVLGVQATLPLPPANGSEEDIVGELDPASGLRAVLECLVRDCLDPLIRGLRAEAFPPGPSIGRPSPPRRSST